MPERDWVLTRGVTREECPWLSRDFKAGERVKPFNRPTYGCIGPSGTACSVDGDYPFFELPTDALTPD